MVLAGVRPEERADWVAAGIEPSAFEPLGASGDSQLKAINRVIESARKVTAKGGHSAVIIDAVDDLGGDDVRTVIGAARNVPGAGSLTIIVAAKGPIGGETTLIRLSQMHSPRERGKPSVDKADSATMRSDLLGA